MPPGVTKNIPTQLFLCYSLDFFLRHYVPSLGVVEMKNATKIRIIEAKYDTNCGEEDYDGSRIDVDGDDFGVTISSDGLVSWTNDSLDHPRNWTLARKFYDIGIVATMEFFT